MTHMTTPWLASMLAFSLVVGGNVAVPGQPSPPSINQRRTVANARIGGSPRLRDGSYNATGVSGACGVIPKEASTLATKGGESTLTVNGQDDMGETIELTVVCS